MPGWFHALSIAMLLVGLGCAALIGFDESRHPQQMWIMNAVWPVSALFGSVLVLGGYLAYGRSTAGSDGSRRHGPRHESADPPFAVMAAKATLHCGSGCTLGDICAEWLAFTFPTAAVWLGWQSIFGDKIFAVWVLDFLFAFAIGIGFQYFTIAPMRGLSPGEGIIAALKADTISLSAWQVGMYGAMAFLQFVVFAGVFRSRAEVNTPEFWFAMQIAMLIGFATSYPVNWWLLRSGLKEKM